MGHLFSHVEVNAQKVSTPLKKGGGGVLPSFEGACKMFQTCDFPILQSPHPCN